jgi:hypothetical protein
VSLFPLKEGEKDMKVVKAATGLAMSAAAATCRPLGMALVLAGTAATAYAGGPPVPGPEIDPGSVASAVSLLAGGALLLTDRLRRK